MVTTHPKSEAENVPAQWPSRGIAPLTLRLPPDWELTNEKLLELCSLNETVPFEVDETGALIVNMPSGHTSEWVAMTFVAALHNWMDADTGDMVYGSGGLFELPDGNRRVPDAAWVSGRRMAGADLFDGEPLHAAPDLVIEVRSRSDEFEKLQSKMELWLRNGVRLAWLVDPFDQQITVYRPGEQPVLLNRPMEISDELVLPGLVIDLKRIWRPA